MAYRETSNTIKVGENRSESFDYSAETTAIGSDIDTVTWTVTPSSAGIAITPATPSTNAFSALFTCTTPSGERRFQCQATITWADSSATVLVHDHFLTVPA